MNTLKHLNLSVRATNVLKHMGVDSLDKLIHLSEEELLSQPNCGKKTLNEIFLHIKSLKNGEVTLIEDFRDQQIIIPSYIYNRNIDSIFWSVRAYKALKSKNIKTLSELVRLTKTELSEVKNSGRKVVAEVQRVLEEFDLHLGMENIKCGKSEDEDSDWYIAYQEIVAMNEVDFSFLSPEEAGRYFQYFSDEDVMGKFITSEILSKFITNNMRAFAKELTDEKQHYVYLHRVFPIKTGGKEETQDIIGQKFNVSKARIEQIDKKVRNKLRVYFKPCSNYINFVFSRNRLLERDISSGMRRIKKIYQNKTFDFLLNIFSNTPAAEHISYYKNEYQNIRANLNEISDLLVSRIAMPAEKEDIVEVLLDEYGFDTIQSNALIRILKEEDKLAVVNGSQIFVIPKTNYLAIANILLRVDRGLHESEIHNIYNKYYAPLMRKSPTNRLGAACSTQNEQLFWLDKKVYAHTKFLNLTPDLIERIQRLVFDRLQSYKMQNVKKISVIRLYESLRSEIEEIDYSRFRYICSSSPEQFHFTGKANKDVVSLCKEALKENFSLREKIIQGLKLAGSPLNSAQIKKGCFITKSQHNFNYVIDELIKSGRIVRLQHDRFTLPENLKENLKGFDELVAKISEVLFSSDVPIHYKSIKEQCEFGGEFKEHYPPILYQAVLGLMKAENKQIHRKNCMYSVNDLKQFDSKAILKTLSGNAEEVYSASSEYFIAPRKYVMDKLKQLEDDVSEG